MSVYNCVNSTIQVKRGMQSEINDIIPRDGEPVYAIDTNRLFIGYDNVKGGHDILQGNLTNPDTFRWYGAGLGGIRGFNPMMGEIIFLPSQVSFNGSSSIEAVFTTDLVDCVRFPNTSPPTIKFIFKYLPFWDRTKDVLISITYTCHDGSASTVAVLNTTIYNLDIQTTPTNISYSDRILVSADTNIDKIDRMVLHSARIPASTINDRTEKVMIAMTRDTTATDSYTGDLDILSITLFQPGNGAYYGYYLGGFSRNFETDNTPIEISNVNRITFPFDYGESSLKGNITAAKIEMAGFNSSHYGFVCGGAFSNSAGSPTASYSSIERITFPFDSGDSSKIGDLYTELDGPCGFNCSNYGYVVGGVPEPAFVFCDKISRINLSFDSFTDTEDGGQLSLGLSYPGSLNSSLFGYIIGGYNGTLFDPLDPIYSAIYSGITRYNFAYSYGNLTTIGTFDLLSDYTVDPRAEGTNSTGTCNSSLAGYTMGGWHYKKIGKLVFPYSGAAVTQKGNLSTSRSSVTGLNSTLAGYAIGGGHYSNEVYYSSITRIVFAYDSGPSGVLGNLAPYCYDKGCGIDGIDFVTQFV